MLVPIFGDVYVHLLGPNAVPASGLLPFWKPVHFGNTSPCSRGGMHSFFIDVEVCINMGCSAHLCVISQSSFSLVLSSFF